jgi:hypothetical protein
VGELGAAAAAADYRTRGANNATNPNKMWRTTKNVQDQQQTNKQTEKQTNERTNVKTIGPPNKHASKQTIKEINNPDKNL